ncbi:alpha-N-acetylneuraminide alpha-2,8-sialyltransferase-like isoform X2 [Sinocyclocheilus rhinocerous]|uniref:alpha-N-acetylneuraminide alpha-2,8-sialyltransferase-like isoform X2 n=1 Tax=Sinocyclocheilus rhinocerous TaxID=307959 RepID=UPI0007B8AA29|nr:PREDICTED: alpha-N-acetylneuraminide alpha-2,8-sialyltransferase-like isoform X2 [Sinocyclocheilus rhinocerous]
MVFLRCHRSKYIWATLGVLAFLWLYIFPVYRIPSDKEMVDEVLRQGQIWTRNQTGVDLYRKLLTECCDPKRMFAVTKENSPIGKVLWYDGEIYHYHTVNNETYPFFVQDTPLQLPLKKCSVVGNGGVLKHSGCGKEIDQADFIMSFQNLLWSRKSFVESMKAFGSSYIYIPAFSMKPGTDPSLRAYHTLADSASSQTVLFANPDFLKNVGRFWKNHGVHGKRLSTGLFLVSLALGLCEEVTTYGFWPFSVGLDERPVSHHYYDNILPSSRFHTMPEEFLQLWHLHKSGTLRMRVGDCAKEGQEPKREK